MSFYNFLLILSIVLFLVPHVKAISFKIPRFNTDVDILYEGDAVLSVGHIEFNKINYLCRVGRATYANRVRLWDSGSGSLSDFTTHFSFTIDTLGQSKYGHGIAFFLAPVGFQIPPNSDGGFLGLFNTTTTDSSRTQVVTIEFDSFPNPEWDPMFEHVGINNNSIASAVAAPWNASLHSGDTGDAYIIYDAATKNLSAFWSYGLSSNFTGNSSLSYQIDLREVLPEWISIGFSAATGRYLEQNVLKSWEFSSSLDIYNN